MSILHRLPYEWLIGLRYTRAGKRASRNRFLSFISLISVAGIALGVAALIVVLSVMNGFEKEVTARMLSVLAHVEVMAGDGAMPEWRAVEQQALRNPAIKAAAPFVEIQGMLLREDTMKPVVIRGVLPEAEVKVSDIAGQTHARNLDALKPGANSLVLGSELARSLDVKAGDKVRLLVAAPGSSTQPGQISTRQRVFTVADVFDSGNYQFDSALGFVHVQDAEALQGLDAPSGLRLRLADMYAAPAVAIELARGLDQRLFVRDWTRVNATWFAAVQSQKRMMFVILTMIIAVAAFNLVSTLVMTVRDKQADIAILRTLGASPRSIMRIFVIQGTLVGVLGALLGVVIGVLFALNVDVIVPAIEHAFGVQFLAKDIYLISEVPSDLRWGDVGRIGGVAVLLAFVATLYPSWSAARLQPAAALRYE
ncbi:lipoprotein-releasing ABC transporter permease subunit [Massilia norwichensis]|uniref:Lipoprotein-releasing ABC transporter permease subunit n=1 Tax=Massilia norwichensis TaxID=1442366 RepID=A0ABT2A5W4_9BURK|nr:lipoprotein-releasing ABC transporter permease subunit [Massilia norwichensis]MCS0589230.1 lipoprotein-releasing ABC transporter permease subunit [Massilia norwichensis]